MSFKLIRPDCTIKHQSNSMRARSLTELELEAIADLDASIGWYDHDAFVDDGTKTPVPPGSPAPDFRDFANSNLPSSTPRALPPPKPPRREATANDSTSSSKVNAGYILYDGTDIKYIQTDSSFTQNPEVNANNAASKQQDSLRSFNSTSTRVSQLKPTFSSSNDGLIHDHFLTQSGYSFSHHQRLPTYAHFSIRQKFYFFVIGMATLLSFNAFHLSLTYFSQPQLFGRAVLSSLGTCHYTAAVVTMLTVVLSKRNWVPFMPSVPACFVLMACLVVSIPCLEFTKVSVPVIAMYALIGCNGLCSGISQALIGGMAALFPGHKTISLVTLGIGFASFLPAIVQLILVLCLPIDWKTEMKNSTDTEVTYQAETLLKDNIYILSLVAFVGILVGLFAVIRLHRSGIYKLFASKDSMKVNPRNVGIYKDGKHIKKRLRRVKVYLLAEILVSAVSMYVLSLAKYAHETTNADRSASNADFWKFHLATVFVIVFKLGDCLGRFLGTISTCCKAVSNSVKKASFFSLSFIRLGFVAVVVLFIRNPFFLDHNLFMMGLYFLLSITNGLLSVAMSIQCQSLCGFGGRDACAVILQITWLCTDLGNAIGAGLSFVPLT